jgi:acetyl esterase/lipase
MRNGECTKGASTMRHGTLGAGLVMALAFAVASSAAEPIVVELWPGGTPETPAASIGPEKEIIRDPADGIVRLSNVTKPMITVFRPRAPCGTAVIVCPGGGYGILAYEHEGTMVCDFLVRHGVTAILLKYRVPAAPRLPLQDAQRAVGMVRRRAAEWGLRDDRIGILGFSAGGHLAIMTALHGNERTYDRDATLEAEDAVPNFVIPIYPAYLTKKGTDGPLLPEIAITPKSPPMCLVHASDDPWTAAGSALVYLEYKKLDIPCELHVYARGGHGFGMKPGSLPANRWPERVIEWMAAADLAPRPAEVP